MFNGQSLTIFEILLKKKNVSILSNLILFWRWSWMTPFTLTPPTALWWICLSQVHTTYQHYAVCTIERASFGTRVHSLCHSSPKYNTLLSSVCLHVCITVFMSTCKNMWGYTVCMNMNTNKYTFVGYLIHGISQKLYCIISQSRIVHTVTEDLSLSPTCETCTSAGHEDKFALGIYL